MKDTREDPFIKLFLSAYEKGTWADAVCAKPDVIDRTKPAVDQLATRRSDGKTLAIEHTIIEPFSQEKEDFASFEEARFLGIERDKALPVPGVWIEVFVPVGAARKQSKAVRGAIVESVHAWLAANRLKLCMGDSEQTCTVSGIPGKKDFELTLTLEVHALDRGQVSDEGIIHIRRQQVESNLDQVIAKSLKRKLPKLVNTAAERRILLLERQHMNLVPKAILAEVERQRTGFPELAKVDEIWILETIFYGTPFGETYLRFERYDKGKLVADMDFNRGKLLSSFEHA